MNVATPVENDVAACIDAALREKPDGILEMVAAKCEASLWQVFQRLPAGQAVAIAGDRFEELWKDLTAWGQVLFIVHTDDIVLECEGVLPPGTSSHGYFNIHGDSPIGGHIKASNCTRIVLWIARSMAAGHARCNSLTPPAMPCSRSLSAATVKGNCWLTS